VPATYASRVARFVVDETGQFRATREAGSFFAGYRDPDETLGEALLRDAARGPRDGGEPPLEPHEDDAPVLVTHLGVGLADLVFGEALRRAALERGVGTALPRG
jgi:ornithine cyclodeaminase/alanine dehydrogenase-like protein (mu-crystallin family)